MLNRAIDVTYPPGSTWKPVTALAALEQRIVGPYDPLLCSPTLLAPEPVRRRAPGRSTTGIRSSATTSTCRPRSWSRATPTSTGSATTSSICPANQGQPLQKWAETVGFGKPTGIDIGPEASGLVPTIGLAHGRPFHNGDRPDVEARRLDPARDRAEGRRRHADPARALLLADRERRQARHAVRRPGRRGAELRRQGPGDRAAAAGAAAAEVDRRRPVLPAGDPGRALPGDPRPERHLVVDLRALRDPGRRQDGHGREGRHARRATRRRT